MKKMTNEELITAHDEAETAVKDNYKAMTTAQAKVRNVLDAMDKTTDKGLLLEDLQSAKAEYTKCYMTHGVSVADLKTAKRNFSKTSF